MDERAARETSGLEPKEIERLLMKPTVQRRWGKYVLLGRLGHGGMGKIYLAYTPGPAGIEKLLVIKRLHSHLSHDPVLVNSFLDEARLSMALSHPHIVHTYDVGEVDGRYFMVMEFIDGQNLGIVLRAAKRAGLYPPGTLLAGFFLHVLEALHAAHTATDARGRALQIIHRDISPQNILVTYSGVPKLVDFGIAKAALRINETDAGVLKGKYAYMSPEQCAADEMDARSDIFSAGIVLWEMLVGKRLYKSDNVVKSIDRIVHEPPVSPTRLRSDCDPHLARVVVKALQKKPADRFANAEEFRNALDEALRQSDARYRSSDMRKLMSDLFGEVQERQRHILESCLAGTAESEPDGEVVTDGKSDSSPDLSLAPSEGSESASFKVISLPAGDEEDDSRGTPSTHTRAERPSLLETKGPRHDASGKHPHASSLTSPASAQPHARTAREVPMAALLALCFLAGALCIGLLSAVWPADAPGEAPAEEIPAARVEPIMDVDAGSLPLGDFPAEPEDAPAPAETTPRPEVRSSPPQTSPAEASSSSASASNAGAAPSRSAGSIAPKSAATPAKKPVLAEPSSPKTTPPRNEDEPSATRPSRRTSFKDAPHGWLTLDTVPWASVYLGTVKLGETPLVKVAVPVGNIELLLVNEAAGIRQPYFLRVEEGEKYRKKLKLD